MKNNAVKTGLVPYLLLGLLCFIYVLARTLLVGITFDESWTIGISSSKTIGDILTFNPTTANNHLLNSILIKLFYYSGIDTTFMARLPNLLSLIGYLYFSSKICRTFIKEYLGIATFVLLISNPFMLDFFGLARGYGLSLFFLMGSLYYVLKFNKSLSVKAATFALILGGIAVLSHFAILMFWVGLFGVIHLIAFAKNKTGFFSLLKYTSSTAFVLAATIYFPIQKLRSANSLWYGGAESLYGDTLYSLVDYSLANQASINTNFLILNILILFFVFALLFYLISNYKTKNIWTQPPVLFTMLLIIPLCINFFLHHMVGTKLLINRTALFYLPLFALALAFTIKHNRIKNTSLFMNGVYVLIVFLSVFNLQKNVNLHRTISWFFEGPIPEVLTYLNEKGRSENKIFILGSSVMFKSSLSYYQWKQQYKHVVFDRNLDGNLDKSMADYYLHLTKPLADIDYDPSRDKVNRYPRKAILKFREEGVVLLSNLKKDNSGLGH